MEQDQNALQVYGNVPNGVILTNVLLYSLKMPSQKGKPKMLTVEV